MKTRTLLGLTSLLLASSLHAEPPRRHAHPAAQGRQEKLVFITGSMIPQRVPLRSVGTPTFSPVRIIDRHETEGTGRFTTAGVLASDPAVSIVGR